MKGGDLTRPDPYRIVVMLLKHGRRLHGIRKEITFCGWHLFRPGLDHMKDYLMFRTRRFISTDGVEFFIREDSALGRAILAAW